MGRFQYGNFSETVGRFNEKFSDEIIKIVRKFIIEDEKLTNYAKIFKSQIERSLDKETCNDAAIKSYITHVNKLPSGQEKGNFLALEFVGPSIRILLLTLKEGTCSIVSKSFDIPSKYMTGKSIRLFDFIAKCLSKFLKDNKLKMLRIPLGVTFGFPIEQISLQDCKLLRWTKGFQCDDLIGENVFTKLKDSIRKFPNLKRIYVTGILNETVSVLLGCTVQDPNCKIGMVIGHGANCCYAEKVSRITKYDAKTYAEKTMYMILDTSGFGEDGSLDDYRTEFDFELDRNSADPGKLITDKMISIAYLGELARIALIRCIRDKLILNGVMTDVMAQRNAFKYTHMMQIESDPEDDHTHCREVLQEFGYRNVDSADCTQIQFVCRCISRRAANLAAAQLAALTNKINEKTVGIALDGEIIREYPNFELYLVRKLNQLKKEEFSFQVIKPEENALGKGAGVMAAIFGEEVMDRDEKLRRLPGFPATSCHFRKTGRCLNPNCSSKHPCDTSGTNPLNTPMEAKSQDLELECFKQDHCPAKKNPCAQYEKL